MKFTEKICFSFLVLCLVLPLTGTALAQDEIPAGPVYVVQTGDTFWSIAQRFGVPLDALIQANSSVDPNLIKAGDELIIPGLQGVQGRLITRTLSLGESMNGLSRLYNLSADVLSRLNRIVSPAELYAGLELILPESAGPQAESTDTGFARAALAPGQSILELAVLSGTGPWRIALDNGFSQPGQMLPGDVLFIKEEITTAGDPTPVNGLLRQIESASLSQVPWIQGKTGDVLLRVSGSVELQGTFMGKTFSFFEHEDGTLAALLGIHAMAEGGLYPLYLQVTLPDGSTWYFSQRIPVVIGNYPFDPDLVVDPATIDPQVTEPENEQWAALAQPVTGVKLWQGLFTNPVDPVFAECWTSTFGNRRSYNGSGYNFFHTGLDFCGAVGNSFYAVAAGEVVFAGPLTVRGNATMINHGWGVYTAYMHQSEILVQVGERVEPGQLIGKVGATGRVSGPHLHWEVWVGGVQVDPSQWLQQEFP